MHFPPFDASISLDMPFHCPIQPNQFHAALIFRLATVVSIDDNFLLLDRPIHAERDIFSKWQMFISSAPKRRDTISFFAMVITTILLFAYFSRIQAVRLHYNCVRNKKHYKLHKADWIEHIKRMRVFVVFVSFVAF